MIRPPKPVVTAATILGLFSVLGTGLVALVHEHTAARIAENQRRTLLHSLQTLIPANWYDNDMLVDAIEVSDGDLGTGEPVPVYRARQGGRPVAAVLSPSAPDGYNGEIRLLVAVRADGTLAGVRVLAHKETPGLGDPIDEHKSDWILGFDGRSLDDPPEALWKVRRDGGDFDQFTGATITPRAVVKAVRKTLTYFVRNKDALFSARAQADLESPVEDR
jgi:electron transport complex protein RnfG